MADGLSGIAREIGGLHRTAELPAALSLDLVQRWCERYERTLRLQFDDKALPPEWETRLQSLSLSHLSGAMQRWALLKHFYMCRSEGLERRRSARPAEEANEAARQLLRREPVTVTLESGRVVELTGRSYAAMYEIASHDARIKELDVVVSKLKDSGPDDALHIRRVLHEILLHRRAVWAHALTATGAPAASLGDAPDWWSEITPADDVALLAALFEAGIGRYGRLGQVPDLAAGKKGKEKTEDFGWGSLFSTIEKNQRITPAALYRTDLCQLLAWRRAGADPPPGEELG